MVHLIFGSNWIRTPTDSLVAAGIQTMFENPLDGFRPLFLTLRGARESSDWNDHPVMLRNTSWPISRYAFPQASSRMKLVGREVFPMNGRRTQES